MATLGGTCSDDAQMVEAAPAAHAQTLCNPPTVIVVSARKRAARAELAQRRRELEAEHQRALANLRPQYLIPNPAILLKATVVVGGFVFTAVAPIIRTTLGSAIRSG